MRERGSGKSRGRRETCTVLYVVLHFYVVLQLLLAAVFPRTEHGSEGSRTVGALKQYLPLVPQAEI